MNDDLCLKWNDHRPTFLRTLSQLCLSDRLTDVLISCGQTHFPAHKLVLTVCSDYFADLFESNPHLEAPGVRTVVCLKDVDPVNMERLLAYMYCGEVTVQEQELVSFLALAKNLLVKGLALPEVQNGDNSDLLATPVQNEVVRPAITGRKKRKRDDNSILTKPTVESGSIKTELVQQVEDEMDDDNIDGGIAPSTSTNKKNEASEKNTPDNNDSQPIQEATVRAEMDEGHNSLTANQEMYLEEEEPEDFMGATAPYRTISGRLQNSKLYVSEGHMYFNRSTQPKGKRGRPKWYLRCRHRTCKGSAVLWDDTDMLTTTRPHTCGDDDTSVSAVEAKEEMKRKCYATSDSIKDIFDAAIAARPESAYHLTYEAMVPNLRRWRSKALEGLMNDSQKGLFL